MKFLYLRLAIAVVMSFRFGASAATLYVDINGTNPTLPYSDWSTAATNIQDAVDASSNGDLILVNDGVYQTGGRIVIGSSTSNRVAVTKAVTVQSVNGAVATIIQGFQVPGTTNGSSAVRCVYLINGATLSGFTLTNGATQTFESGGGVNSFFGIVTNCIIVGNAADSGGGASLCTLVNCELIGNVALALNGSGGGADACVLTTCEIVGNEAARGTGGGTDNSFLFNCTLTGNYARSGGGSWLDTLSNCVVYFNTALNNSNYLNSTMNYCCTIPFPTNGGVGNIQSDPQLTDAFHIGINSPCIGAGSAAASAGVDIDGESWANPPSIGCDEYSGAASGDLSVSIQTSNTNLIQGFAPSFTANIGGWPSTSSWDFGDGTVVSNEAYISHAWFTAGDFSVTLHAYNNTYPDGVSTSIVVHVPAQTVIYVSASNTAPLAPYISWTTAATNIQDAVNTAWQAGSLILVSNGVYKAGGAIAYGVTMSNRVAVTGPFTLQSVNGPTKTFIQGIRNIMRCVYLTNGASLMGFTLTNGGTVGGNDSHENSGGGIWCESVSATVSNCIIISNIALAFGGGSYSGTLMNCILTNNSASLGGGGACLGILTNCSLLQNNVTSSTGSRRFGGGACSNILYNCVLAKNGGNLSGGGAYSCILSNCMLNGNWATNGGGATYGALFNCTFTNNLAFNGGAAASNALYNCFIANNVATNNGGGSFYSTLTNCTLLANAVNGNGGGAAGGMLINCLLTNNSALKGGGGYLSILFNCLVVSNRAIMGGGIYSVTATACIIRSNLALSGGGGSYASTLNGCVLVRNICSEDFGGGSYGDILNNCELYQNLATTGGGAYNTILNNCTVANNSATFSEGGTYSCYATNSIIYNNVKSDDFLSVMDHCCSPRAIATSGNFTNVPLFVDRVNNDFHLQSTSPCINSGNNSEMANSTDLDGNPRIVGGTVDIGAYEYQTPGSTLSYAWAQQYGLLTDGSVDNLDSDGDGMNNYAEWKAGTNPTNVTSVLKLSPPSVTVTNLTITWQSVSGVIYYLQRATDLAVQPAFSAIQSNIVGQSGTTSYTDTLATNSNLYFYRIGVQ